MRKSKAVIDRRKRRGRLMVDNQGYDRERDEKAARNKRQRRMREKSSSAHTAARGKGEGKDITRSE